MRHPEPILPWPESLTDVAARLARNAIRVPHIYLSHTLHSRTLSDHHQEPFDRILVSQTILEGMPLLSVDSRTSRYPVEVI